MTTPMAVVPSVPTPIIPTLVPPIPMPFLIPRNILPAIPLVLHKEDRFPAGVIFVAVLAPILTVARRYAQIDRRAAYRCALDYDRLTIDHLRLRKVADIEPAIEAGLADADGDSDVGSECRSGYGGRGYCRCDQKTFHVDSPVVSPM
jgi:hypothetical protein